ncbi:glycoside hydrolase family 18 protein [Priestia abyssalis]|uniref:glycoside hydrolase family 18 protein n=1 Tax=Priestia abyssalis TaxID=1221450 RepID=UPI0009956281|nr:glycoside hydrolase family 18 protein [Priestia abyssalis]
MTKRKMLLMFVIMMTFAGGFTAGVLFSNNQEDQKALEAPTSKKALQAPVSQKELKAKTPPKPAQPKVLMGYVQEYRNPNSVDYSKLTHVIFSFAHPTKDGHILLNGDTALNNLKTMVKLAHEHDTKAILAVGGWFHMNGGETYGYFKEAIANPASRTTLVNELSAIAERENLDGIDIDFEHPRSNKDALLLSAFTKELSQKLHAHNKELSIAVYAKIHSVTGTEVNAVVFEPSMFNYTDHVNIMAYDGQWDGGYDASNLSPYPFAENIVHYWKELFEKQGLSKEKLVLGVPVYAQPENESAKQLSYAAIVDSNPDNAWRDVAVVNGMTYHYNGRSTMQQKTKLALDNGFGGMMLWEAGHDAPGGASLTAAISEAIQQKQDLNKNTAKSKKQ